MAQLTPIIFRTLLAFPALAVMLLAVPRLIGGVALEAVFPIPSRMEMNVPLEPVDYRHALKTLSSSNGSDGEAWILRAEAAALAGEPGASAMAAEGLSRIPASTRAWILIAETSPDTAMRKRALERLLRLFPHEYWLAGRKVSVGAALWPELSEEARAALLVEAKRLWTEPTLRTQLWPVLAGEGGSELLTRAFADDPEGLREMNRWVALRRWRYSWGG